MRGPSSGEKALPRAVRDAVLATRRLATVGRAARATGLLARVSRQGLSYVLREAGREPPGPSMLSRFLAHNHPHRVALIAASGGASGRAEPGDGRAYSFFELDETMDRLALAMSRRGLGPSRGAVLLLSNRPEHLFVAYALARIGAPFAAVSPRSQAPEVRHYVKKVDAAAVFAEVDATAAVDAVRTELSPLVQTNRFVVGGDAAGWIPLGELSQGSPTERGRKPRVHTRAASLVSFTSGTTGVPKAAMRTVSRDAVGGALTFIAETPMRAGQTHLSVCPLYHATAQGFVGFNFLLGNTVVLLDAFRPEAFLAAIERHRVHTTAVVPTMLHRIAELGPEVVRRFDTSSLNAIFCGGAALSPALAGRITELLGEKLWNFYGATETGVVTVARPEDLRAAPGTIGRPVAGAEVRVLREDGRAAAPGEVGELYARTSMMVDGYKGDEEATRAATSQGFFAVGDLAYRDRDGRLFLAGRSRELIISGGVNVYPAEVEAALEEHPGVGEAAVVGQSDDEWGERVVAFVTRTDGDVDDEPWSAVLLQHCRARLAGPKVPRALYVVDAMPLGATGKVDKRALQVRLEHAPDGALAAGRDVAQGRRGESASSRNREEPS